MDTLVSWKKRRDKYRDNTDGDDSVYGARTTDTIQNVEFIKRDETNAKAMRILKIKPWWK
jgi:hypothetical protein